MRQLLRASLLAACIAGSWPARATADVLLTPYAGLNFGGSTIDKRGAVGGSIAWLGSRGLGFEVDLGFIPNFFKPKDTTLDYPTNNVTTLMGNLVFGRSGGGIQPYVSAGAGLLRSNVGSFGEFFNDVTTDNGLGVNAGAGVRLGRGKLSLRGDVRYFRTLTGVDIALQDVLGDFSFWRATGGLSIGF
ncbi:MAG: outer membrane beta-barrel protein [Acidobacteriota bacterium]